MLEQSDARRAPPPFLSPPQVLPVLGRQCAEDRLQGHAPPVAVYLRAWQDRAVSNHRRQRGQAAGARPGDQARPLPWPAALRDPLTVSLADEPPRRVAVRGGELEAASAP